MRDDQHKDLFQAPAPGDERTAAGAGPLPLLWMVIPCYNEQDVLPVTAPLFLAQLQKMVAAGQISDRSRILFVNDGSHDQTWAIIRELAQADAHFIGISQSRNRGHQNAVLAGLMEAKGHCDITISIDCDGQDDLAAMSEMVEKYRTGAELVYGVRSNRDSDRFLKRFTAQSYYKLLSAMGVDVVYNHADYRLISDRVLQEFQDFKEVNLYLRGLLPLVGFPSERVYYKRAARLAGESHYPVRKMLALAFNGITSLSVQPIRIITSLGFAISLVGFVACLWAFFSALFGHTVSGWASMFCLLGFLSGIQLLSLGVIGSYIGKIYLESKHRPRYIISERTWAPYQRHYKG